MTRNTECLSWYTYSCVKLAIELSRGPFHRTEEQNKGLSFLSSTNRVFLSFDRAKRVCNQEVNELGSIINLRFSFSSRTNTSQRVVLRYSCKRVDIVKTEWRFHGSLELILDRPSPVIKRRTRGYLRAWTSRYHTRRTKKRLAGCCF